MQKRKTPKKEAYDVKPLEGPGSQPELSAKIGGVGNTPTQKDESKKGGK
jgi:hypothetical protein